MFDFLSWGHVLVIGLAALFIFGPERLPTLAADAGRGVRRLRDTITSIRDSIAAELGEDLPHLKDLDVRRIHPGTFFRSQLFDDDGSQTARPEGAPGVFDGDRLGSTAGASRPRPLGPTLPRVVPPPFDFEAT